MGTPSTDSSGEKGGKSNELELRDDDIDDDDSTHIGQEVQAHIPDIVLNNLNDLIDRKGNISIPNEHTYDNSTLLFLDVSGFTSLTEQYSNDAHRGIDQLTSTLNAYFDKLVYEILAHDGDIYKFAGDAILSLWTDENSGPQQALKCALHLQQKCGGYETDVGVVLRVKVALAYGSIRALFVGTEEFKHYLLTGDCVKNVNICEQLCEPGDIIITKAVYEKLDTASLNCEFVPVSEEIDPQHEHIAVKYSQSRRSSIDHHSDSEDHVSNSTVVHDRMDLANQEITNDPSDKRPSISDESDHAVYSRVDSLMKSFILHCVHHRIERRQSLDYLSELRRVTISFINLDVSNDASVDDKLHTNIDKIFVQIYELTKMMGGVLTKGLLFDKGWSFLCVFGLPGYKQGDDTANALKCAQMIHSQILEQCQFVKSCSIGVTTGLTYCGVVGHRARCEYTVIGRKVNMAARLMCNYPGIISCDQETYYNSRLSSRFFRILPDKSLKGMNNVGSVWHYGDYHDNPPTTEQSKTASYQINDARHEELPLLGRRVELMVVATQIMLLDVPPDSNRRRRELAAIIFEGEDKIGRSRLLQFISDSLESSSAASDISTYSFDDHTYIPNDSTIHTNYAAHGNDDETVSSLNNYSHDCAADKQPSILVVNYRCQFEKRYSEFSVLRSLLKQLLQFHKGDKAQYEREQYLLRLFDISKATELRLRRNLFLLNDLCDVRFRHGLIETESDQESFFAKSYETNLNELLSHILNKLIESTSSLGDLYSQPPTMNSTHSQLTYTQSCTPSGSTTSLSIAVTIHTFSKVIFIIDDIHFADGSSLKHLLTLGSHPKCLLILSMKPPRNNNNDRGNCNILQSITTDSRVYLRRLPGLELRYLATLGCQILSVHRLPAKLVKVFNESCNGTPGFCEQILFDLLSKDIIYLTDSNDTHEQDADLVEGDADKLIVTHPEKISLFKAFFSRRIQPVSEEQRTKNPIFSRVCLLRDPAEEDFTADCQQNFQNYIMCRIDRLSEGETLLVKTAAVIGNTFSRVFLWQLVDPHSKTLINISSCILEMMQRNVIECAHRTEKSTKTRSIKCFCLQNPGNFPSQCRLMAFTHSTIREGIYNSLTDGLKRALIRNAIDYLENQSSIICSACGSGKIDSPFLVHDHDGLAKFIKNRQQPAFADIVKSVALKEIDDVIKHLSRTANSPVKARPNTSPGLVDFLSVPSGDAKANENKSANIDQTERSHSADVSRIRPVPAKEYSTADTSNGVQNENIADTNRAELKRRDSEDPNLILISLCSPDAIPSVQISLQRSLSSASSRASRLYPVFKLPNRHSQDEIVSQGEGLKTVEGSVSSDNAKKMDTLVEASKKKNSEKTSRLASFIRYLFCQFTNTTATSNATVTPAAATDHTTENNNTPSNEPANGSTTPDENQSQEQDAGTDHLSHWKKVRKAVLPTSHKARRSLPSEDELLEQSMFSSELMAKVSEDLNALNNQVNLTRAFQILYDQSMVFYNFQSYAQHNQLVQYICDQKQNNTEEQDIDKLLNDFTAYNDLRMCDCIDYIMTVYNKLVGYHTNLYDIYDKTSDDKRDYSHLRQFDRVMYYRTEICRLLLGCNALQRLMVEIENGRRFLERFEEYTHQHDDFSYQYLYLIMKYTYNLFEATLLQRTKALSDSKQLCERDLKELNEAYDNKIWEKLVIAPEAESPLSAKEKQHQYEHSKDTPSKEGSLECGSGPTTMSSEQLTFFTGKYRLEYLLCHYHLLKHELVRLQSTASIDALLNLQYHTFPLSFSLSCTIILVEHFYCQSDYQQCLTLIHQIIQFWWSYVSPREKLEFAKLKSLALIIELKQGSVVSAIASGYFAKRLQTNYHENVFLFETCIYLTLALIGEMRISNIELILQHLEYLSEQTMSYYGKLWYYTLTLDVAIELGYELMPITSQTLSCISKYHRKLLPGSHGGSLGLFYTDCTLAQIYARWGSLDMSKIHLHQALFQIKYNHVDSSVIDFRFQRALLKLVEAQLIHWYHTKEPEESWTKEDFLLTYWNAENQERLAPWNRTRYLIYQAYYDRLINDYRRQAKLTIDNDYNWKSSLEEATKGATKLDLEWIENLRRAWSLPAHEQIPLKLKHAPSARQNRRSALLRKSSNHRFLRPAIPRNQTSEKNGAAADKTSDEQSATSPNHSQQKFVDWRSFLNNTNSPFFQLYILPVKV